ncbi:MAG TPA: hypothetical protein VIC85_14595 [Ktedonobacterales bacterium]
MCAVIKEAPWPSFPTRRALALLGALICRAARAPTATVSVPATATAQPTATPTPVLAQTPTNVPTGWNVLATTYFSLTCPPDWTVETLAVDQAYTILLPPNQYAVQAMVFPHADVATDLTPYCHPESEGAQHTTVANLPMTLKFTGLGNSVRVWRFANVDRTLYYLVAGDTLADGAAQARYKAIFATFRPDNATPWTC